MKILYDKCAVIVRKIEFNYFCLIEYTKIIRDLKFESDKNMYFINLLSYATYIMHTAWNLFNTIMSFVFFLWGNKGKVTSQGETTSRQNFPGQ